MWEWQKLPNSNRWWGLSPKQNYRCSTIDIKAYDGRFYLMRNNEFDIENQTTKLPSFDTLEDALTAAEMMMAMGVTP